MNMKREIKFRGKIANDPNIKGLNKGDWWTGFYYEDLEGGEWKSFIKCGELDIEVDKETLCQYIGLKDKNGKEIYEGDILAGESLIDGTYNCGYVKYGNFNCSCCDGVYGWYLTDGDIRMLEEPYSSLFVIGNIHDDKELLNKIYDYE